MPPSSEFLPERKGKKLIKGETLMETLAILSRKRPRPLNVVVENQNEFRIFSVGRGRVVERVG